jgi:hypothetical protein
MKPWIPSTAGIRTGEEAEVDETGGEAFDTLSAAPNNRVCVLGAPLSRPNYAPVVSAPHGRNSVASKITKRANFTLSFFFHTTSCQTENTATIATDDCYAKEFPDKHAAMECYQEHLGIQAPRFYLRYFLDTKKPFKQALSRWMNLKHDLTQHQQRTTRVMAMQYEIVFNYLDEGLAADQVHDDLQIIALTSACNGLSPRSHD